MNVPKMEIPNITVDELLQTYMKVQEFKKKERERLAKYYLKKRLDKAGCQTLEEYQKLKDNRGCKMKYFH